MYTDKRTHIDTTHLLHTTNTYIYHTHACASHKHTCMLVLTPNANQIHMIHCTLIENISALLQKTLKLIICNVTKIQFKNT